MATLLTVLFILAAVLVIVTPLCVFLSPHISKKLKKLYVVVFVLCVALASVTTFFLKYNANQNTRVYGWPVPIVIFQRDGPNAPWLDYVGPTPLLAYPVNLVLYLCVPSLLIVLTLLW